MISAIYVILAVSLDLLAGEAGLLSVSHAGFFGVGAYTSALVAVRLGGSFLLWLLSAMAIAAILSMSVSIPSMRLHDDYFIICTFGLQMILFNLMNNWQSLTAGPFGISAIPAPRILGIGVTTRSRFAILAVAIAILASAVVWRLRNSAFGRVLRAIREDEMAAQAFGKNTVRFKIIAFAISAAIAGTAGSLYAHYSTFIDPTSFSVTESILVLAMVIIGGAGSFWGPAIGAVLLVVFPEMLRFLGLPVTTAADLRQILYGTALVLMMIVRPKGMIGTYELGS